jgi:hypothetical protein
MKNLFAITEALSVMLISLYVYFKTKNKCFLWAIIFGLFFATILFGVKNLYIPGVLGLIISGIAFVVAIILIQIEDDKNKGRNKGTIYADLNSILVMNKKNALFWGVIIIMNLIGFLLGE